MRTAKFNLVLTVGVLIGALSCSVLPADAQSGNLLAPLGLGLTDPKVHGDTSGKPRISETQKHLDRRPLAFIENKGQFDNRVKFQAGGKGQTVWLTDTGIVFDFLQASSNRKSKPANSRIPEIPKIEKPIAGQIGQHVIYQDFIGANHNLGLETRGVQQGAYNYLAGSDPSKWHTQARGFSEIVYHDVWNGVDLKLTGNGPDLEQEFVIRPGADVSRVRLSYKGIDRLEVANDGSLVIRTTTDKMRETAPRIYQEIAGRRIPVKGRFKLLSATCYTFEISTYNDQYALVIDPTLLYSTFLGGSAGNNPFTFNNEVATGIAVDTSGNAYATGFTASTDFPTTAGAFQTSSGGLGQHTFVTKLDPTGSTLVYSTYLNAAFPVAISVDQIGNAYVAGGGAGGGFPTTPNAYSQSCGGGFLTVLNPSGSGLVYSTCFGADHTGNPNRPFVTSMATDRNGRAYIIGNLTPFDNIPTTANAYQPAFPGSLSAFVTVLDTTASGAASLIYSTYLSLTSNDPNGVTGRAIAVDSFGKIYLTGVAGDGFPVTPGAYQTMHSPCVPNGSICPASENAFIAKLDPSASGSQSLIYATYFGGMGETNTEAIAVDSSGAAYITGITSGSHYNSFPVTPGAFQPTVGTTTGASFVAKLNAAGSQLVYSTFVSDRRSSIGNSIAVDSLGNAYVAGEVDGSTFPVTPDAFQSSYIKQFGEFFGSAFLAKLNPAGSALIYSTYLGGSRDDVATAVAVDQTGDAYVAGRTSSADFPVIGSGFQPAMHGTGDAFVTKFPLNETFRVLGLSIDHAGNVGKVTPTVFGSGFHAGFSATLVGGQQIIQANQVTNGPLGRFLYPTFDLTGVAPGIYSVTVTSLDGSSQILSNSFTIEQGGTSDIWMDVSGRSVMRGGLEQLTTITVGNRGTVDSSALRVWVTFPAFLSYRMASDSQPTVLGQLDQTIYLAFDIPTVHSGATVALVLGLILPDDPVLAHRTFLIQVWKDGK